MDVETYFRTIAEYKLLAKHEVGQNFLIDSGVASRIVSSADLTKQDHVLEIGSGAGSLSYFIANSPAEADLIDIDEGLVNKLKNDFQLFPNVHPQIGNIMRYDVSSYQKIIGNLPYYITSGILERLLLEATSCSLMVLMVQKEAFERLTAKKGSKDYGPLPLLLEMQGETKRLFSVPRVAFLPMPHVDSVVFSFSFYPHLDFAKVKKQYAIINACFLHRRKTIQNNLSSYLKDSEKAKTVLLKAGIASSLRPEDLSLAQYQSLCDILLS